MKKVLNRALIIASAAIAMLAISRCGNETIEEQQAKFKKFGVATPAPYVIDKATGDTIYTQHLTKTYTYTYETDSNYRKPFSGGGTVEPPKPPIDIKQIAAFVALHHDGSGVEQWHDRNEVAGILSKDHFARISAGKLSTSATTINTSWLDANFKESIDKGGKFGFSFMTYNPDGDDGTVTYSDGTKSSYPEWLHKQMQSEPIKDWKISGSNYWIPNYNSPYYLSWVKSFLTLVKAYCQNTVYKGLRYYDAISGIDIRFFGTWGEWHYVDVFSNVASADPNKVASEASLRSIIQSHIDVFNDKQLYFMICAVDNRRLPNVWGYPGIKEFVLNAKTSVGPLGMRRDNWGAPDDYLEYYMNSDVRMLNLWKTSPLVGEPCCNSNGYALLYDQVIKYHGNSFGNGNFGVSDAMLTGAVGSVIKKTSAAMGYRLSCTGGTITTQDDGRLNIKMNFLSNGLTPIYEPWTLRLEVRIAGKVVSSTTSAWSPVRQIGLATSNDFITPPSGIYDLYAVLSQPGRPDLFNTKIN